MPERILPGVEALSSSVSEIHPPFESDMVVANMLFYARDRYLRQLDESQILKKTFPDLKHPSKHLVTTIERFRKHAVRYRSVMWICGYGAKTSKFDSEFFGLPDGEEDFIYRLGQYKDAVNGYGGTIKKTAQNLISRSQNIHNASGTQEIVIGKAPLTLAKGRIVHTVNRIYALATGNTITDRGMHDLRILIRVMRDVYATADASAGVELNKKFVSWLDVLQKACNIWRFQLGLGEGRQKPKQDNLSACSVICEAVSPPDFDYPMPQAIATASQELVNMMCTTFSCWES